jgi:hypothetical protein
LAFAAGADLVRFAGISAQAAVFGIGLGIDTGGIALKFALFTAQLALAIVADFFFVRIANIAAFAAVFGIG